MLAINSCFVFLSTSLQHSFNASWKLNEVKECSFVCRQIVSQTLCSEPNGTFFDFSQFIAFVAIAIFHPHFYRQTNNILQDAFLYIINTLGTSPHCEWWKENKAQRIFCFLEHIFFSLTLQINCHDENVLFSFRKESSLKRFSN